MRQKRSLFDSESDQMHAMMKIVNAEAEEIRIKRRLDQKSASA